MDKKSSGRVKIFVVNVKALEKAKRNKLQGLFEILKGLSIKG